MSVKYLLLFLLSFVSGLVVADGTETDIKELLRQLDDDDWRVRERAHTRLEMLGAVAAHILKVASVNNDSLEVRIRALRILKGVKEVSHDDAKRLEKLAKEFFKAADDKKRSIVHRMRPVDNAVFWIFSQLSVTKDAQEKEKWAKLLYWFEFGRAPKSINDRLSVTEEVLSQVVWHPYTRFGVRTEAVRLLGINGSTSVVGTIVAVLADEVSDDPFYEATERASKKQERVAKKALVAVVSRDPVLKGRLPTKNDIISDWWEKFKGDCKEAAEDYELRRKHDEQRRKNQPFLGVMTTTDPREKLGGALIMRPEEGTGAARAGIQPDDLITELDGWKIECWNDLIHAIRHCEVGDRVPATIKRGEKTLKIKDIEITRRPDGK